MCAVGQGGFKFCFGNGVVRQDDVHTVKRADATCQLLRCGDVGEQHPVEGTAAETVAGTQQSRNRDGFGLACIFEFELVAEREIKTLGEIFRNQHAVRLDEELRQPADGRIALLAQITAKGRFGKGIDAEQLQRQIVEIGGEQIVTDDGCDGDLKSRPAQISIDFIRDGTPTEREIMRRSSRNGFGR